MPDDVDTNFPYPGARRSFSLANALQEALDAATVRETLLQQKVLVLLDERQRLEASVRWYAEGIADMQKLARLLKIAREGESYRQMFVRLAVEAGYCTPEEAASRMSAYGDA